MKVDSHYIIDFCKSLIAILDRLSESFKSEEYAGKISAYNDVIDHFTRLEEAEERREKKQQEYAAQQRNRQVDPGPLLGNVCENGKDE